MSAIVDSLFCHRYMLRLSAFLLLVVVGLWLFQVQDSYLAVLPLAAGMLFVVGPIPFRHWSMADWLITLFTVYDMVLCFYGACLIPALRLASFSLFCLIAYLLARRVFVDMKAEKLLFYGSYVPVILALGIAICSFYIFRDSVLEAGFADTYSFRFLYRPLGYITNQWAEVLLVLLGWICLARRHISLLVFLIAVSICLSFSRGAYIALGVFVLVWLIGMRPWNEKFRIPLLCVLAAICIGFCFPKEMTTTLRMNATVSQQQSTEARMDATQAAWKTFSESGYPMFGFGNGSYSFAIDHIQNQDSTQTYTNLAPNLIILILVEKGWLGLVLGMLLFVAVCRLLWKKRNDIEACVVACTILAVGVKEMTQANLFNLPLVWLLLYLMIAYLQRGDSKLKTTLYARFSIPVVAIVFYGVFCVFIYSHEHKEVLCEEAVNAFRRNRFDEGAAYMEQTGDEASYCILRGLYYVRCYQKTDREDYVCKALSELQNAAIKQPDDVQIQYLRAYVYLLIDRTDLARPLLEELVRSFPANTLYRFGLWKCLYTDGQHKVAFPHLLEAIRLTPRILTHSELAELERTDTVAYQTLRHDLSCLELPISPVPADYARLGYIAHWNGENEKAEKYLRQAVNILPNLSTPWRLLGEERKYRLLLFGAFRKNLFAMPLPEEPALTDELLLVSHYGVKFSDWYGCKFLIFEEI